MRAPWSREMEEPLGRHYWNRQGNRFHRSFFGAKSTLFYLEEEQRLCNGSFNGWENKKLLKLDAWNEAQNTAGTANGALGVIIDWINAVFTWTGGPLPPCNDPTNPNRRPIQPISIYHRHCGRCGEHADLVGAVCRTALIPIRYSRPPDE